MYSKSYAYQDESKDVVNPYPIVFKNANAAKGRARRKSREFEDIPCSSLRGLTLNDPGESEWLGDPNAIMPSVRRARKTTFEQKHSPQTERKKTSNSPQLKGKKLHHFRSTDCPGMPSRLWVSKEQDVNEKPSQMKQVQQLVMESGRPRSWSFESRGSMMSTKNTSTLN